MKKLSLALALTATLFAMSCKKDDPAPSDPGYVGYWKGKYATGGAYPNLPLSMLFKNNGTVRIYDGADSATASKVDGTYTVSGVTVNTTYSGGTITATLDMRNNFQEGTVSTGAKFWMVKQ